MCMTSFVWGPIKGFQSYDPFLKILYIGICDKAEGVYSIFQTKAKLSVSIWYKFEI